MSCWNDAERRAMLRLQHAAGAMLVFAGTTSCKDAGPRQAEWLACYGGCGYGL